MQVQLGQLMQVQLFVVGKKVDAHFEPVGFVVVVGCHILNWGDFSNLDCIC